MTPRCTYKSKANKYLKPGTLSRIRDSKFRTRSPPIKVHVLLPSSPPPSPVRNYNSIDGSPYFERKIYRPTSFNRKKLLATKLICFAPVNPDPTSDSGIDALARCNLMAVAPLAENPAGSLNAVLNVNASCMREMPEDFSVFSLRRLTMLDLVEYGFGHVNDSAPNPLDPLLIVGDEDSIRLSTDNSSCFDRNKVALRMKVRCDITCPHGGVGVYNPGFWGMNIEKGKTYKLIFYLRAANLSHDLEMKASLTSPDGLQTLASANISMSTEQAKKWTKVEHTFIATASNTTARLQFTTNRIGSYWLDQVSLMPTDTHKGHGFRKDLYAMLENLSPSFMRFPGGTYVQGKLEENRFRWKESIGPWENRSGHFNDNWHYWTDDALGYYELLLLAEDLGATPIWVFNVGMGADDFPLIKAEDVYKYVQEALDGVEFATGSINSTWGSVRAEMGHPEPFTMKYVSVGNENCFIDSKNHSQHYEDVVYPQFYNAFRKAYPNLKLISNCDATLQPLKDQADLFDFHPYMGYDGMFNLNTKFDNFNRKGPKVFVSEYAVTSPDCGIGCFHGALSEAAFYIGLERNSDIVELACYAPLFANVHDIGWRPDAIWFNSWQTFGSPSYWVQYMVKESSGATLLSSTLETNSSAKVVASAIISHNVTSKVNKIKVKVVNYEDKLVNLRLSISDLNSKISASTSTVTVLSSGKLKDQNTMKEPNKVVPQTKFIVPAGSLMDLDLSPRSFTAYDLILE